LGKWTNSSFVLGEKRIDLEEVTEGNSCSILVQIHTMKINLGDPVRRVAR